MTDTATPPDGAAAGSATTTTVEPPLGPPRGEARNRRQLRWMLPLALLCVAFVAFALPPYLTFDPSQSQLPGLREGFPLYYPLLVTHILFGSVALLAGCMQVWPWFRHRYPAAHRTIGRVYVFGGVLPAGIAVLGVAPLTQIDRVWTLCWDGDHHPVRYPSTTTALTAIRAAESDTQLYREVGR